MQPFTVCVFQRKMLQSIFTERYQCNSSYHFNRENDAYTTVKLKGPSLVRSLRSEKTWSGHQLVGTKFILTWTVFIFLKTQKSNGSYYLQCICLQCFTLSNRNRQLSNQWLWPWYVVVLIYTGTNICACKKATLLCFICKLPLACHWSLSVCCLRCVGKTVYNLFSSVSTPKCLPQNVTFSVVPAEFSESD